MALVADEETTDEEPPNCGGALIPLEDDGDSPAELFETPCSSLSVMITHKAMYDDQFWGRTLARPLRQYHSIL